MHNKVISFPSFLSDFQKEKLELLLKEKNKDILILKKGEIKGSSPLSKEELHRREKIPHSIKRVPSFLLENEERENLRKKGKGKFEKQIADIFYFLNKEQKEKLNNLLEEKGFRE